MQQIRNPEQWNPYTLKEVRITRFRYPPNTSMVKRQLQGWAGKSTHEGQHGTWPGAPIPRLYPSKDWEKRSKPWVKPCSHILFPQLSCSHSSHTQDHITAQCQSRPQTEQLEPWEEGRGYRAWWYSLHISVPKPIKHSCSLQAGLLRYLSCQVTQVLGASQGCSGALGLGYPASSPQTCSSPPSQQNSSSPPAWPLEAAHPHWGPQPAASPGLIIKINGN